jgi:hypothetical protein
LKIRIAQPLSHTTDALYPRACDVNLVLIEIACGAEPSVGSTSEQELVLVHKPPVVVAELLHREVSNTFLSFFGSDNECRMLRHVKWKCVPAPM